MIFTLRDLFRFNMLVPICLTFGISVLLEGISCFGHGSRCQAVWSAENRALRNHANETHVVPSAVICSRNCYFNTFCKSINVLKHSGLLYRCELNNATRAQHPKDFITEQGSWYFDAEHDTQLFSVLIMGRYSSCKMLLEGGYQASGIYTIYSDGFSNGLQVYCDMETDGGGWTVFQRRQDGSVDFNRTWDEYKLGFGDLNGEFWLGNDNLQVQTNDVLHGQWELRVDIGDRDGNSPWAKYSNFKLIGQKYTLHFDSYDPNSTVGDALVNTHKNMPFSAKDQDNDKHTERDCAQVYAGGWWFKGCLTSNLNGEYLPYQHTNAYPNGRKRGIFWQGWHNDYYFSFKNCSMKIRQSKIPW